MSLRLRLAALAVLPAIAGAVYFGGTGKRQAVDARAEVFGVSGRVLAAGRPVPTARVRIKGQGDLVLTDVQGRFQLPGKTQDDDILTAAKEGYFIAALPANARPLEITLTALPTTDCERYKWVDPTPDSKRSGACGNCHQAIYDEWRASGHAQSAVNRRFQNLLDGSDWHGKEMRGWGLAGEYPEGVGVCWSCHAPSLPETARDVDVRRVGGVSAAGVHCDFCHKIRSANVETAGLTHGRFGYELLRPAEGQLFFGPLDDVDRGEDAYSPLQSDSRFCAACHEGTLFGVAVYTTWSEWLASPAARRGRQCQSCHAAPSGMLTNVAPSSGGIERDPATLANHSFLPGGREAMLRGAIEVACRPRRGDAAVDVAVTLQARNVGHRLPTGFIDRQLILIVEPFDGDGQPTAILSGEQLPPAVGDLLAGKPGRLFAKLLTDVEGHTPAPFWRAGVSMTDTRLLPEQPESFAFRFSPSTRAVRLRVLYRRFWQEVAESKHWPHDDVTVYDRWFDVPAFE